MITNSAKEDIATNYIRSNYPDECALLLQGYHHNPVEIYS